MLKPEAQAKDMPASDYRSRIVQRIADAITRSIASEIASFLLETPMKLQFKCVVGTLILGLAAFTLGGALAGEKKVKVGDPAPAFQSVDDQGKPWKSADHVGKN